ncbi:hypothetical protein CVIRNUC_009064 [Coccomyxa viridis]|uniref:Uncharacterized protein n=1 Tax=Coccomyxa viridis TaxID=1274662 RepID=A0AAV1IF58_9CHLO|nr:hypothetical protein CVIRNUC_009064 [Coccomyxa viridis]
MMPEEQPSIAMIVALQRRAHHLEVQIQELHSDRLALQDMVAELSPVERVYGDKAHSTRKKFVPAKFKSAALPSKPKKKKVRTAKPKPAAELPSKPAKPPKPAEAAKPKPEKQQPAAQASAFSLHPCG